MALVLVLEGLDHLLEVCASIDVNLTCLPLHVIGNTVGVSNKLSQDLAQHDDINHGEDGADGARTHAVALPLHHVNDVAAKLHQFISSEAVQLAPMLTVEHAHFGLKVEGDETGLSVAQNLGQHVVLRKQFPTLAHHLLAVLVLTTSIPLRLLCLRY